MSAMSEKDKEFLRNAAMVSLVVLVIANPKGAAKLAAGAVVVFGAAIWGIRSLQS